MKSTLITAIILAATATSASAFTCKNTVERVNNEWVYTSSQCGNQAPASQDTLDAITFTANNPSEDREEEVVVVEAPAPDLNWDKLTKLGKRDDKLHNRLNRLNDKINAASGPKKKALKKKRKAVNKKIKRVNRKIYKLSNGAAGYVNKKTPVKKVGVVLGVQK